MPIYRKSAVQIFNYIYMMQSSTPPLFAL